MLTFKIKKNVSSSQFLDLKNDSMESINILRQNTFFAGRINANISYLFETSKIENFYHFFDVS